MLATATATTSDDVNSDADAPSATAQHIKQSVYVTRTNVSHSGGLTSLARSPNAKQFHAFGRTRRRRPPPHREMNRFAGECACVLVAARNIRYVLVRPHAARRYAWLDATSCYANKANMHIESVASDTEVSNVYGNTCNADHPTSAVRDIELIAEHAHTRAHTQLVIIPFTMLLRLHPVCDPFAT